MSTIPSTSRKPETSSPTMLTVDDLASRWNCSIKHVRRQRDAGLIPAGVRIGRLLRFPVAEIEQWERDGCPTRSRASRRKRR
ncbi:MAG: helix-turn-helix domain-containing protein [Phycisphaera sp. RhM]|nr:helix-turn-helix domain-containing protein [Phycisphaera sp. RhM]